MARFASLFPSSEEAERAASELSDADFSEDVLTQVISQNEWERQWDESDKSEIEPGKVVAQNPTEYMDIWLDEDTIRLFSEGVKQGGAVLVVDVPDPFAREAEKIMQKNNGKIP